MTNNKPKQGKIFGFLTSSVILLTAAFQANAHTLPTDGLVLHLEADSGVTVAMGTSDVTDWADQSAQLNDVNRWRSAATRRRRREWRIRHCI